ncbi:uncharacterized protein LOC120159167 [Hibiscus syriacus]|uniref:uncharacterized protein LOC120159167 n=1 Tax=Hibiscus syriacus TaxID=106335 RepID=UPI001923F175|nr:uncharacterized protein LOC120159167 [Hibiscus syriacus]
MGLKNRVEEDNYSMNEALLLATMCIIGLPVDVHLKDGSIISGTFHTGSVEKEYGIVLKKAKLTKKGDVPPMFQWQCGRDSVISLGVPLPFDGFAGNTAHANGEAAFEILPSANPQYETRKFNKSTMDKRKSNKKSNSVQNESGFADGFIPTKLGRNMRVECCCKSMGNTKEVSYQKRDGTNIEKVLKFMCKIQSYCLGHLVGRFFSMETGEDASGATIAGRQVGADRLLLLQDDYDQRTWHSVSSYESSAVDTFKPVQLRVSLESCHSSFAAPTPIATDIPQYPVCSGISTSTPAADVSLESAREFKLNPGAKFSLHLCNCHISGFSYGTNRSKCVTCQTCNWCRCYSIFSTYCWAYGGRTQQLRYGGQYHPVQATPAYLNPNPQEVIYGRLGQLICVPVSHDLVQGAATLSPEPARPLTAYHVQFPKHQGQAFQLCVPQPFIAGGQQPLAVPSHIPFLQPRFPVNHPIQVPGSKGIFSAKLP